MSHDVFDTRFARLDNGPLESSDLYITWLDWHIQVRGQLLTDTPTQKRKDYGNFAGTLLSYVLNLRLSPSAIA